MENTDGWIIGADLGFRPMETLGWQVEAIRWRRMDSEAPQRFATAFDEYVQKQSGGETG